VHRGEGGKSSEKKNTKKHKICRKKEGHAARAVLGPKKGETPTQGGDGSAGVRRVGWMGEKEKQVRKRAPDLDPRSQSVTRKEKIKRTVTESKRENVSEKH